MTNIQIVPMTVELVNHTGGDQSVLDAMLVSTLSDREPSTPGRDRGRINFLMANRHGSPFEHNTMTFRVKAPIAVFREWHRHRTWSFNEQSGRYTEFAPEFYLPGPDRPMRQVGKPGAYEFETVPAVTYRDARSTMLAAFDNSWRAYRDLLADGIGKEVARGVLPVFTMSTMYATCNARSLMAFLSLRRRKNIAEGEMLFESFPMWEIDDCAEKMETIFAELFPMTYAAYVANGRVGA